MSSDFIDQPEERVVSLTPPQRAFLAAQRRSPGSPAQNMAMLLRVDEALDPERLAQAFHAVVAASDVLRTRFDGDTAILSALPSGEATIRELPRAALQEWAMRRAARSLDLSVCGYDSVILIHEDGRVSWFLNMHHTINDARGAARFIEQVGRVYETGEAPAVPAYYRDQPAPDSLARRAQAYWSGRPRAPRPSALYRSAWRDTSASERLKVPLCADTRAALEAAAAAGPATPGIMRAALLTAASALMIHRMTGESAFSIGLAVALASDGSSFGPQVEVFPVDIVVEPGATRAALVEHAAAAVTTTLRAASPGCAPPADYTALVNVLPKDSALTRFAGCAARLDWLSPGATEEGVAFYVQETHYRGEAEEGPRLQLDIGACAADPEHRARAPGHFAAALEALILRPVEAIGEGSLCSPEEHALLDDWEHAPDHPGEPPFAPRRLAAALADNPGAALEDGDLTLTGPQLLAWAQGVAAHLRADPPPGGRVGVQLEMSAQAVAAVYGALLAGVSFVPIDPSQPPARRARLLELAGIERVFDDPAFLDALRDAPPEVAPPPPVAPGDADEAYLIFTSGSTGEPKGVPIPHWGLAWYLRFAAEAYFDETPPVSALFGRLSFDLSIALLFSPVLQGGKLVALGPDGAAAMARMAERRDITWCKATPSHLRVFLKLAEPGHGLRTVVLCGEASDALLARNLRAFRPDMTIFNQYGPTETVVGCMIYLVGPGPELGPRDRESGDLLIGRPSPGVTLRIVDQYGERVPVGAAGELLIHHAGIMPGYLNDATAGPFIENAGRRFYRSGDLVRLLDYGELEYLGRIDAQLKVSGMRLDPSEVEAALGAHPLVGGVNAGLWRGEADDKGLLTAWFEPAPGAARRPTPGELRAYLARTLPAHAVPAAYVPLDAFPMTANGKLDRAALPAPGAADRPGAENDLAEADATIAAVIKVWEEQLTFAPIGPEDDFFALGGDSLQALEMISALGVALGVSLRPELVFSHPTPRGLAGYIDDQSMDAAASAGAAPAEAFPQVPASGDGPPPLSVGEESLLFEQRARPDKRMYNVGRVFHVRGAVDAALFESALTRAAMRHEPLRWTYAAPRREMSVAEAVTLEAPASAIAPEAIAAAVEAIHRPVFELESGPALRALVQPVADGSTLIVFAAHHARCDHDGFAQLWEQVAAVYGGAAAPEPVSGYGDVCAWQETWSLEDRARFWLEEGAGAGPSALRVEPTASGSQDGFLTRRVATTPTALRAAALATPVAALLAAIAAGVRPWLDGDVAEMGLVSSVRMHPDAKPLCGYFLNPLPIRFDCPEDATLPDLADQATTALGRVLPHRNHPLAHILSERRAAGLHAEPPRVLASFDEFAPALIGGCPVESYINPNTDAVTDLSFFLRIGDGTVDLGLEFSGRIGEQTAAAILERAEAALAALARGTAQPLVALPVPGAAVLRGPDLPEGPLILERFLAQAAMRPDAPAVICGTEEWSWAVLEMASAAIAARLTKEGVGRGDRVLVRMERSPRLVAAILGTLRAGAAYAPVDVSYPSARVDAIAQGAAPALILTDPGASGGGAALEIGPEILSAAPGATAPTAPEADDPAYMIFTSGSTGAPRGVTITHRQLSNSTNARDLFYDGAPERFAMLSSPAFDSSIVGLFWPLATGGAIILPTEREAHDVDALAALISRAEASHLLCVPTLYRMLLARRDASAPWVRQAIVAGEACPVEIAERHFAALPGAALTNEYGPTEASVWTTAHHCAAGESSVPAGLPIPGAWVAVLGPDGHPCPPGVAGELILGGPMVAAGYANDPEASAARFGDTLTSPVFNGLPGSRCFRSGDRAVLEAGAIRFLGRADDQINLGGARVEPGEVEAALVGSGLVGAAVVTARDMRPLEQLMREAPPERLAEAMREAGAQGDPTAALEAALRRGGEAELRLVAHIEADGPVDIAALRRAAREALPPLSRPDVYVLHDALPRSANGKLDRAAAALLPLTQAPEAPTKQAAPATAAAPESAVREMTALFARILHNPDFGADQSFFEHGGDSLHAMRLLMALEQERGVRLPTSALYDAPNPAALAALLNPSRDASGPAPIFIIPCDVGFTAPPAEFHAAIGANRPVVYLEHPCLRGDSSAIWSLPELATHYVEEIERRWPQGPILLGAFCLGAYCASEAARQLSERGRPTPHLVAFDPNIPRLQVMRMRMEAGASLREAYIPANTWYGGAIDRLDRLISSRWLGGGGYLQRSSRRSKALRAFGVMAAMRTLGRFNAAKSAESLDFWPRGLMIAGAAYEKLTPFEGQVDIIASGQLDISYRKYPEFLDAVFPDRRIHVVEETHLAVGHTARAAECARDCLETHLRDRGAG